MVLLKGGSKLAVWVAGPNSFPFAESILKPKLHGAGELLENFNFVAFLLVFNFNFLILRVFLAYWNQQVGPIFLGLIIAEQVRLNIYWAAADQMNETIADSSYYPLVETGDFVLLYLLSSNKLFNCFDGLASFTVFIFQLSNFFVGFPDEFGNIIKVVHEYAYLGICFL